MRGLPKYLKLLLGEWLIESLLVTLIFMVTLIVERAISNKSISMPDFGREGFLLIAVILGYFLVRTIFLQIPLSLHLRKWFAIKNGFSLKQSLLIIVATYVPLNALFLVFVHSMEIKQIAFDPATILINIIPFIATLSAPTIIYFWKGELFETEFSE